MAKNNAHWFHTVSSLILKPYPNSSSIQRTCILHVDGAQKEGHVQSGTGFTASLPNGSLIAQHSISTYSNSALQVEIQAIQQAITWALKHNYNVVYILSDCFNAIMIECHHHDAFLIHNLREEIAKLSYCRILKVKRKEVQ